MRQGLHMNRHEDTGGAPSPSLSPGLPPNHHTLLPILKTTKRWKHRTSCQLKSFYANRQTKIRPKELLANSPYFHKNIKSRQKGSICLLFLNANSLPVTDKTAMKVTEDYLKTSQVSFLALQETWLNTNHKNCLSAMRETFHTLLLFQSLRIIEQDLLV